MSIMYIRDGNGDFVAINTIKGDRGETGDTGRRGTGLLNITTAPSSYTTTVSGLTPAYRIALSTVKTQSGATEIFTGDTLIYSYYYYPIIYVDTSYIYCGGRVSIRGATGAAGAAGYAPVRGTDYWTETDKAEIKSYIDNELQPIQTQVNQLSSDKADKSEGVFYIEGSGTTDSTAKTSTWVGTSDRITAYYDGLTIRYKIGVAGQSTTTLNINSLGAKTIYRFNTTKLTTQFPVGSIIHLIYHEDLNGGCWVTNDYDSNTNTYQRVYPSTTDAEYPITSRYNTTTGSSYYAEYGRYTPGVTLNPYTNTITATAFKGKLTGNADTATKATQDASGNVIASTYETKADATAKLSKKVDFSNITQEAGDNENLVMSQKAVTELVQSALDNSGGDTSSEYETVDSVEEMVDTSKSYILSTTGTIWTYGDVGEQPAFTNLADPTSSDWLTDYRLSSSGGVSEQSGCIVTNYIPCSYNDTIRIKGVQQMNLNAYGKVQWFYDSSKTPKQSFYPANDTTDNVVQYEDNTNTFKAGRYSSTTCTDTAYGRFSLYLIGSAEDVIITVNEEITYTTGKGWYDTGIAPGYPVVDFVSEMTDTTKSYVLSSTNTIWTYGETEKEVVVNQFVSSEATYNARIRSNGEIQSTYNGVLVTNKIPVSLSVNPYTVKISGIDITAHTQLQFNDDGVYSVWYASDDTMLLLKASGVFTKDGSVYVGNLYDENAVDAGYVRFAFALKDGVSISETDTTNLFIEVEPKNTIETVGDWVDTGLTPESAGGSTGGNGNYIDLLVKVNQNKTDITELDNRVTGIESASGTVTVPTYWADMVAEKTETIKALQTAGGKDCVCFAWASDTHIPDNDSGRTNDIGKVMAKMLDNCEIPFAVLSGDINTRASYGTEAGLVTAQESMSTHLAPLWGTDRLLVALGNHDGCWGDSTGYYRHQFTPERMWQIFFRNQALDLRRVFSDDGSYYYVDNIPQKTRFIVLNSHFGGEYAEDSNGWAVNNRFGTSCFGQAQLDWLADEALDMPNGYSAIITAHVPPNVTYTVDKAQFIGIINAYCNKTTYSGSYTAGVDGWTNNSVSVDFTGAKGEIIAMFAGHVHGDSVDTTTLACPLITILSAGASANSPYSETAPTRTFNTDTETSFDVVCINKATKVINCVRVGAGADRSISYSSTGGVTS